MSLEKNIQSKRQGRGGEKKLCGTIAQNLMFFIFLNPNVFSSMHYAGIIGEKRGSFDCLKFI